MSMQKLLMAELKKIAEKNDCELIINYQYSNTGKAWFMNGLSKKIGFSFDFQNSKAILQFFPGDKEIVGTCGFTHTNCFLNAYISYVDDLDGWLEIISVHLNPRLKVKERI